MSFWTLCVVMQLVLFVKGEPSLQVFKTIDGTDVAVAFTFREAAGTSFTLKCKLVGAENDTSNYFDDELSWGWNRKNVQFSNIADLKNLADNISNPLKQFINNSGINNEATLPFQPLLSSDSGKFFCMSLKYKLFKIVYIRVLRQVKYELRNKIEFDVYHLEDASPQVFNKSSLVCGSNMFMCNSRKLCIHNEHVCDNIKDCSDGSDENDYLCGVEHCEGKTMCYNGRCLSESVCCDPLKNFNCNYRLQPSCCSVIIMRNYPQYKDGIPSNFTFFDTPTVPKFHFNFDEPQIDVHLDDLNNNNSWLITDRDDGIHRAKKVMYWIALVPVMILMIILRICIRREVGMCCNGLHRETMLWSICTPTRNNQEDSTPPNNSTLERYNCTTERQTHELDLDLPPSYNEAVVNVPKNISLLK